MNEVKIEPELETKIPTSILKKITEAGWNVEGTKIYSTKYEHVIIGKINLIHTTNIATNIEYTLLDIPLINRFSISKYISDRDEKVSTPTQINKIRDTLLNKMEKLTEIAKNNNMMIKGNPDRITIYDKDKRALIGVNDNTKIQCKSERGTLVLAKRIYGSYLQDDSDRTYYNQNSAETELIKYGKELDAGLKDIKPVKLLTKDILPKPRQFDINYVGTRGIGHGGKIWQVHVQKISHLQNDCIFYDEITDPNKP